MSLIQKPEMTEKNFAAQPRRGVLSQPWATPRVQGTTVWGASPERARYDFHPPIAFRWARPFRAGTWKWVCLLTQADGLGWDGPPLWGLTASVAAEQCGDQGQKGGADPKRC